MEKLLCLTCNKNGVKKIDEIYYHCVYCNSYFDEKQNIINDWSKTIEEEEKEKEPTNKFDGLGLA